MKWLALLIEAALLGGALATIVYYTLIYWRYS